MPSELCCDLQQYMKKMAGPDDTASYIVIVVFALGILPLTFFFLLFSRSKFRCLSDFTPVSWLSR